MKRAINRRKFGVDFLAAAAAALPILPRVARAQSYPTRPVRIVVGFPPGSGPDIVARLTAQWLSERFGQQFIVDNQPGASGNIGTETVVRAHADGYTLLLVTSGNAIDASLYPNLNFNFLHDIAPTASVATAPFVMVVNSSFPAQTVPEFIAYAKANPGKINMASVGNGSAPQVFGELFMMMTGVDLVSVSYRGNYLPDLLAGQVQVLFGSITQSIALVRTGKLRALAVTTATRLEVLPDVPTVAEFVPGYEAGGWYGIGVPKNTSAEIIATLNHEITAATSDPQMKARLIDLGLEPRTMTPTEFGTFIADETEKWAKVIKFANIKAE